MSSSHDRRDNIRSISEARSAPEPLPTGRLARMRHRVVREVRSRPFGYVVFAVFVVTGPLVVHWLFPEAHPLVGIVGGFCFGAYAALCAVPQKFL